MGVRVHAKTAGAREGTPVVTSPLPQIGLLSIRNPTSQGYFHKCCIDMSYFVNDDVETHIDMQQRRSKRPMSIPKPRNYTAMGENESTGEEAEYEGSQYGAALQQKVAKEGRLRKKRRCPRTQLSETNSSQP